MDHLVRATCAVALLLVSRTSIGAEVPVLQIELEREGDSFVVSEEQDRTVYRANMLSALRRRELSQVAGQLAGELGLDYSEAQTGQMIEGIYRRTVELLSGRFAVIEKALSADFGLGGYDPDDLGAIFDVLRSLRVTAGDFQD